MVIAGSGPPILGEADYITFDKEEYEGYIPETGSNTVNVKAKAYDENDNVVAAAITYSIETATGISINSTTGAITITDAAEEGTYEITAEYGALSVTADLVLIIGEEDDDEEKEPFNAVFSIGAEAGTVYTIGFVSKFISGYNGVEITLKYDTPLFSLVNIISRPDVTITHTSPGVVKFITDVDISTAEGTIEILTLQAASSGEGKLSLSSGQI